MARWFDSRLLSRAYRWGTSSVAHVIAAALILAALLGVAAAVLAPWLLAVVTVILLSGLGLTAYRIRQSGVALDYPGIDSFFQQVPCYLSIQDRDFNIHRTNKAFRRDFGDQRGQKCYRVYKGADTVCPNCPVEKTFADGQVHTTEETVITKDGRPAQMIVYTQPVRDEQGQIAGVMEMSTNITDVKALQQELETERREYENLFDRVPCYISIQDRDYRIIRTNEYFTREFGDAIGRHCWEVFKRRDSMCPHCHAEQTLTDGEIHGGESTVIKKDGTTMELMVYATPIYDHMGNLAAVMEMSTDITQVKQLQRELTLMGKTIAVMAHRIKNILMGLEGGIFVVNTGMDDDDETMVKQGWGMIERNVKAVSRIVKDLLYCSKEREMTYAEQDPAPIVRNVYDLFVGRARKEGLGFELECDESLPSGQFDEEAIHSMLTNLVTNAIDACLSDATEGKEKHWIRIQAGFSGGNYRFEVEDNGAGIPGAVSETVFTDFFSTKGREGTGLGLLVAQKVAEAHGGAITFRSAEGKGTVFRAVIPSDGNRDRA